MAILVNPNNVKVISQNGEVTLALQIDLNINLNTSGVTVGVQNAKVEQKKEESAMWEVPDFAQMPKLNFGKKA